MNFLNLHVPQLLTMSDTDLKKFPEQSMAVSLDWRKVPRFLAGTWPELWPEPLFLGEDNDADAAWIAKALTAPYVVFDVETVQIKPEPKPKWSKRIFQVGLYAAGVQPAIWDRDKYPEFEERFVEMFRELIGAIPSIAHNAQFDTGRMRFNFGVEIYEYLDLHDTIVWHHVLWAEMPHNLAYCLSVYSKYPKAKHLGVGDYGYLVGDVVGTGELRDALMGEFDKDTASWDLYQETLAKLLPITVKTMQHGFPVNDEFVVECLDWLPDHVNMANELAQAYIGFEISLSSPKLKTYLEEVEPIYDAAKKAGGITIKKELTPSGQLQLNKDAVNALRNAWLPVDHNEELTPDLVRERIDKGAHPLLEAKALHGKARVYMSNYIKPLLVPLTESSGEYYYEGSLHVGEGSPDE